MLNNTEIYKRALRYLLQPVWESVEDESVSEILINGPDHIYIERKGKLVLTTQRFRSTEDLQAAARNLAQFTGKTMDEFTNDIESRLPDGSRVHIVLPPAARNGICISIRKFSKNVFTLDRLVSNDSLTPEAAEFLEIVTKAAKNVLVSGGTGSGKTSLLNALSAAIPSDDRIIVIEDASELQLMQEHVVSFETRKSDGKGRGAASVRDLFKASLRMRPDRVVVGEIRGGEALDMLQAMNSGHSGSMSTVHANTPKGALARLETLALLSGVDIPLQALRAQIASAIDILVQTSRMPDGSRRITHITEVGNLSAEGSHTIQDIFRFDYERRDQNGTVRGALRWTACVPEFAAEIMNKGYSDSVRLTEEIFGRKTTHKTRRV